MADCEKEGLVEVSVAQSFQIIGLQGKLELSKEEIIECHGLIETLTKNLEQIKNDYDQLKNAQEKNKDHSDEIQMYETEKEEIHE